MIVQMKSLFNRPAIATVASVQRGKNILHRNGMG